jgi:hypothetical protein
MHRTLAAAIVACSLFGGGERAPAQVERRAANIVDASLVRLEARALPLERILEQIELQTGNRIVDERPGGDAARSDMAKVEAGERPFWPLLDDLAARTGATLNFRGRDRAVRLSGGGPSRAPVAYRGLFRFSLDRVLLTQDFRGADSTRSCVLELSVQAEPKARIVEMRLVGDAVAAWDDQGAELGRLGPQSAYVGWERDALEANVPLRIECPSRSASELKRVEGRFDVVLAAGAERFVFDRTTGLRDVAVRRPGLTATLLSFDEQDEGMWVARIKVERPADAVFLDSFQRSALAPDVRATTPSGQSRPPTGGMNSTDLGRGAMQFEYFFVGLPGEIAEYALEATAPAELSRIEVPFAFESIPLP